MADGIFGNITATGNIVANTGNNRMAAFSRVSASGTITGGNLITLGVVSAVQQVRSASLIGNNVITVGVTTLNASGSIITGSVQATGNVSGGNVVTVGRVSATGNVSGNYILGNGYFLTGLAGGVGTYGNTNVAQFLPTYTGVLTGSSLTVGASTLNNNNLSIQQNIVAGNTITAANLRGTTLSLSGNVVSPLAVSGTVTATNVNTPGQVSATGNVQGGNLRTVGTVSATGNITGNYIFGNGAFLTGIASGGGGGGSGTYGNANVAAYLPTYTGSLAPSVLVAAGTVTAGTNLVGQGLSVSGQAVISGNLNLGGRISTTGNITGGSFLGSGVMSTTGAITGASLSVAGAVSASGNVAGLNMIGNGYSLTNVLRSNTTRTVYVSTAAPTSGQGVNGDIWYQTY